MSIKLPSSNTTVVPEYAAIEIKFNRGMQPNTDGHLVPVFTASIAYARTDYLVDADGNKVGQVSRAAVPPVTPDPYTGWIYLDGPALAAMEASVTPASTMLDTIADAADSLIQQDLTRRGLL
ncbi:hypothetical protein [Mesoterricola sediminis]|uniref:Uncharacterized protein n=1 Tax=Mesoterricola sediminis TaxID=2927980 RepID=A0AA48KBW2_9BACT|nr:hypothetical protein [Mesoterricola sediminis]BDU76311.1 hypothetical protein METESE_12690 [Mesoterricola sediminis]